MSTAARHLDVAREDGLAPSRCTYVVGETDDGDQVLCDAPILWGESLAGRPKPLEPEADIGGDWVVIGDGRLLAISAFQHTKMMGEPHRDRARFIDHYCPARARDCQEECARRRRTDLLGRRRADVRRKRRLATIPLEDEELPW